MMEACLTAKISSRPRKHVEMENVITFHSVFNSFQEFMKLELFLLKIVNIQQALFRFSLLLFGNIIAYNIAVFWSLLAVSTILLTHLGLKMWYISTWVPSYELVYCLEKILNTKSYKSVKRRNVNVTF